MRQAIIALGTLMFSAGMASAQAGSADVIKALDGNKDGAISQAEFQAMSESGFKQADANGDGKLTGTERRNHHGQPGPEQTRDEFVAQSMGVFKSEDTNKDGTIAGDEVGRLRAHIEGGSKPVDHSKH